MNFKSIWPHLLSRSRILTVDCGASHVAAGLFSEGEEGGLTLERFACEKIDSDPALDASWSERVGAALTAAVERTGLQGVSHLALPGHLTLTRFTRSPSVDPERRASAVHFEAQQNIPCPLDAVVWDHLLIADDGLDLEVMLAAAKVETIGSLHAAVSAAGFKVEQITPSGLGLFRAFRHHSPSLRQGVVVADIGARSTNLVFIEGDRWFMRTLAHGGNAVTHALAGELRIDFQQAEELKLQLRCGRAEPGDDSARSGTVQRAVTRFASRLEVEIARTTAGCRRHMGPVQPETLYLTGGGSLLPALPGILRESLNIRVVLFDPLRRVVPSPEAREAGATDAGPMLASLVGLATGLIHRKQPAINLLPRAQIGEMAARRSQPRRVAAATLAVAAMLAPLSHYHRLAAAAQSELGSLEDRLGASREAAEVRADRSAKIANLHKRIADLEELAGAKSGWAAFLADLTDRLASVGDVWLDALQVVSPAETAALPKGDTPPVSLRLALRGRLLDIANPASNVSAAASLRAGRLVQALEDSTFVATVENTHFDSATPGILGFGCTIVIRGSRLL